ncbi:Ubiquinone biosynthesis protein [Malassezia sp. CBS 17886]|nr:Ubiquinone biosynthesis protein [Malassezia sp. CBS 17886]
MTVMLRRCSVPLRDGAQRARRPVRRLRARCELPAHARSEHTGARADAAAYGEHERPGYGIRAPFWERALLGAGSALGLLVNPARGDLLSVLTQVSSFPTIDRLVEQMRSTHEGRRLLLARPSLNSSTVDIPALEQLADGTFGREWVRWLHANHVGPDGRCEARYMPTLETRYVIQRYRETHDFYHVLLGMPTSTLGETVVKYFEFAHMHLPVAALAAAGGSLRIVNDDRNSWVAHRRGQHAAPPGLQPLAQLVPWAWELGRQLRAPLITLAWENRWEQDLGDLRAELGLSTPPPFALDIGRPPRQRTRPAALVHGRRFYGWPSRVWERHGAPGGLGEGEGSSGR